MLGVASGVNYPPEFFDVERISSYHMSFYNVLNKLGNFAGLERHAVHLSEAMHVVIGGQFQEDKIGAAAVGRGIGDYICLEICYFHSDVATELRLRMNAGMVGSAHPTVPKGTRERPQGTPLQAEDNHGRFATACS